tara:strand:- start:2508 stop:2786 length:279 start_codon:yes stop_codon:yes gene_type:complete
MDIRDLELAERDSGTNCPIARALGRRLRAMYVPVVSYRYVWIVNKHTNVAVWRQALPQDASIFTEAYDHGHPVAPIRFKLRCPASLLVTAEQ